MGLGKLGATKAAKIGGVVSVILISAYHIANHVLTDQSTHIRLIGTLAVVFVGILATWELNRLDQKYRVTDKVISELEKVITYLEKNMYQIKLNTYSLAGELLIGMIDVTKNRVINIAKYRLKRLF
ncbi:hypothetical protein [Aliikangiella maris]|uniref:Uncharacterized protein n=2 Tax=Aliikangiella maris TaxID=3162458 RepID=A0ABV3MQC0_9GAMM